MKLASMFGENVTWKNIGKCFSLDRIFRNHPAYAAAMCNNLVIPGLIVLHGAISIPDVVSLMKGKPVPGVTAPDLR